MHQDKQKQITKTRLQITHYKSLTYDDLSYAIPPHLLRHTKRPNKYCEHINGELRSWGPRECSEVPSTDCYNYLAVLPAGKISLQTVVAIVGITNIDAK